MLSTIERFGLEDHIEVELANMNINLPNGSTFLFRGLQDPERIKSITDLTDAWLEEASEFSAEDANQIDLRIRAQEPNLQIYYTFNPVSKANWTYQRWFAPDARIPDDTKVIHTTYRDNKFLPQSYRDTMQEMAERDPVYYKVYALGEFASLGRRVYNNWEEKFLTPDQTRGWRHYFGLDFGYVNDPTALIAVQVNPNEKEMYIYDEFSQTGMMNDTIADMIKAKGYSKEIITADSAERKSIDEIRRSGVARIRPAKKGPDSVNFGINKIQQYKIYVSPECSETIQELNSYTWQKDRSTGEYINKPVDNHNHLLDALRYAVEDVGTNKTVQTFNKGLLGL